MRIGTKLTLALSIPVVLLIAGFGYLDIRRSAERYREELRSEGRTITRTVQLAMQDALRDRQLKDVQHLVDEVTGFERVFGLRLFDPAGHMTYQSASLVSQSFRGGDALRQVLVTRKPLETRRTINGEWVVTFIAPLEAPDGTLYGAVQLLQLESFVKEDARASRNAIVALTVGIILVSSLTLFIVTHYVIARPLRGLVENIRALQLGGRSRRLPVQGGDELAGVAEEFNVMVDRLESAHASLLAEQRERRQAELGFRNAERLAALGQLAAGLAHEIGTPLNVIGGRTDLLIRKQPQGDSLNRNLRIIAEQINRIARIVREMLGFARISEPRLAPTAVGDVLRSVLEFVEQRLEQSGLRATVDIPPGLPTLRADADQLYEVFLNLVLNAADAMGRDGRLQVGAHAFTGAHPERPGTVGEYLVVEFLDDGEGIQPEHLGRVFDPFFTTKSVGRGSGLGLSVAYGIVQEHGGWIDVQSRPGAGTRVAVYLPREPLATAAPVAPATTRTPAATSTQEGAA